MYIHIMLNPHVNVPGIYAPGNTAKHLSVVCTLTRERVYHGDSSAFLNSEDWGDALEPRHGAVPNKLSLTHTHAHHMQLGFC
jgi:hypothetical protein